MEYSELYIDPDISLNSLLKKIEGEPAEKLVIIIHQQSFIFTGQVNIELIKKYAQQAEKELIFITEIEKIKNLLADSGFKVYSSLEQFEAQLDKQETTEVKKQNFTPSLQGKSGTGVIGKTVFILVLILVLGGVWFYFWFPPVTIQIAPITKNKTVVSQVKGKIGVEKVNWKQKRLPLIKKQVEIEQEIEASVTGEKKQGISRSTGELTFINRRQQEVVIPAGTKVAASKGIRFETLHKVTVPGAKVDKLMDKVVSSEAGRATTKIEAVQKGSQGNIAEGKITEWAAETYPVELVNLSPLTGGQDKVVKIVTKEDIARGRKAAKEKLKKLAREKLSNKFADNKVFFEQNIKIKEQEFISEMEPGTSADQAIIEGKIKAVGFGLQKEGLKDLVFKLYKEELDSQFKLQDSEVTITGIEIGTVASNQVTFKVKTSGQVIGEVNKQQIIKQIIGKEVTIAKELLDKLPMIETYTIKPANQVNLPDFEFGLNLEVKEAGSKE